MGLSDYPFRWMAEIDAGLRNRFMRTRLRESGDMLIVERPSFTVQYVGPFHWRVAR